MTSAPATVIRRLGDDDLVSSVEVLRRAFQDPAEAFGLTEQSCPTNAAFVTVERLTRERERGQRQFGVFADGVQVGFFAMWSPDRSVWELEKVGVVPERRRSGIGAAMIRRAAAEAVALGGRSLRVGIIEESTALKSWYSRQGFVHLGTKVYDHLPFTVGTMELSLTPRPGADG